MCGVCDNSGTWWYKEAAENDSFEEADNDSAEPLFWQRRIESCFKFFITRVVQESKEVMRSINDITPLPEQTWKLKNSMTLIGPCHFIIYA